MTRTERIPTRLRVALASATATVAGLGLLAELAGRLVLEGPSELVDAFSLSVEGNVPTWYASTTLAAASILLGVVSWTSRRRHDGHGRRWALLSLLFAYVSLDETACFHEKLNAVVDGHGVFFFGWVLVAVALLLPLSLLYLPLLVSLPATTRRRFVIAALLYVGGAVGMELPLGAYTETHGDSTLAYSLLDFVEETLELSGTTVFLLALLEHLHGLGVRLVVPPSEPT